MISKIMSKYFSATIKAATPSTIPHIIPPITNHIFPVSPSPKTYKDIKPAIEPYTKKLMSHPLYNSINSIEACQMFMESHAFAVWDFMTLLKWLQINLTTVSLPWVPPKDTELAYFINSIVIGEESDDLGTGRHIGVISHYDLYLSSMREVGSDIRPITNFVGQIQNGSNWREALAQTRRNYSHLPANTFDFVEYTMRMAETGSLPEVAACFLFGREDPIPEMFQKLLAQFNEKNIECPNLKKYLARHIEVDGDAHAPMADLMLGKLCDDPEKCQKALKVGQEAIKMRMHLWDGIYYKIK